MYTLLSVSSEKFICQMDRLCIKCGCLNARFHLAFFCAINLVFLFMQVFVVRYQIGSNSLIRKMLIFSSILFVQSIHLLNILFISVILFSRMHFQLDCRTRLYVWSLFLKLISFQIHFQPRLMEIIIFIYFLITILSIFFFNQNLLKYNISLN